MTLDRVSVVSASDDALDTVISTPHHAHADLNNLVVFVRFESDELPDIAVTDTAGNFFQAAGSVLDPGGAGVLAAFFTNAITGDSLNIVTATLGTAKTGRRIIVIEYAGLAVTGVLEARVSGSGFGATAFSSAINTENENDIIVIGAATDDPSAIFAAGLDYTLEDAVSNLAAADRIVVDVQNNAVASITMDASYNWLVIALALSDTESIGPAATGAWPAQVAFEVDWTNTGVWVDETARLIDVSRVRRGRNRPNPLSGRVDPGALELTLDNRSGRYSPFNAGSGIYSYILPSRPCRYRILEPVAVTRFTGFLKSIVPDHMGALPVAKLSAQGPFSWFGGKKINPPASSGALTGVIMGTILDAAGWPGTNLCTNGDFETNVTGWTAAGSNTIARSTAQAKYGSASARCTYGNGGGGDTNVGSWPCTLTPVQQVFSKWVWIPSSPNYTGSGVTLSAEGFTSAAGTLSASANLSLRDQWQRLTIAFTPAAGDLAGFLVARAIGAANTNFFYIDGIQIEKGSVATTFQRRQLDAGQVTTSRWFLPKDKDALEAGREIEETEIGLLLEYGNGDIGFQDKNYRITGARTTSQQTYSDEPGATYPYLRGIQEMDSLPDLINELLATVTPYTVNSIADLWQLIGETPTIGPGASKTWFAEFPSPGSGLTNGAYVEAWTTPVVGTDLTQTGVSNSDITVTAQVAATTLIITVTNNHVSNTATITLLKARGTAVLKGTPTSMRGQDTTSQGKYGQRTYRSPAKWLPTTNAAQDYCDGLVLGNKDPIAYLTVPFLANLNQTIFTELVSRDISDRVTITATASLTGLNISADFFIEAIEERYDIQNNRYEMTFELSLAATNNNFWVLGTSVLDTSTVLGF